MSTLDNVLGLLDKWPLWRRMMECPDKVDSLEKRVAELEQKIGPDWPPDVCKFCGKRSLRLTSTLGPIDKGKMKQHWSCGECHNLEVRIV